MTLRKAWCLRANFLKIHTFLMIYWYFSELSCDKKNLVGWLVVLRINVDLAIFQPYLDLEAGDNQSLKIQVARQGIQPRSSCSASQELNHSATAAPDKKNLNEFSFHTAFMKLVVFLCPLVKGLFHKYCMKWKFISDPKYTYCIQLWIRPVLFSPFWDLILIRQVLNSPTLQFSYIILYI